MATDPQILNLVDEATLVIDSGNYFTAPPGTPAPTDLRNIMAPWVGIGHTSLEDIFSVSSEGGDKTVLGTLQKPQLRNRTAARTETFSLTAEQWTYETLKLYYGANAPLVESNRFVGVPVTPVWTKRAFISIFVDGENTFAMYAPLVEIARGDDISLSDTESLAGLPLMVSPLQYSTNDWTYAPTPLGGTIELATTANSGTPGSFSPAGSAIPYDMDDLSTVTASPATAWGTGEYVVLGDGSNAFWDGTAWVTGIAA